MKFLIKSAIYQKIVFLRILGVSIASDGEQYLQTRIFGLEVGDGPVVLMGTVYIQVLVEGHHLVGVRLDPGIAVYEVSAKRNSGVQVRGQHAGLSWINTSLN